MNRLGLVGVALSIVVSSCISAPDTPSGPLFDAGADTSVAADASVQLVDGASPGADRAPISDGGATTCATPTTGPTSHGGSVNTETWTAAASPHVLPYDTTVYGTLTIEPCAEVQIAAAATVTVRGAGRIVAEGTPGMRIHIGPLTAGKPFANIRGLGNTMRFAYTTIEGGGDRLNTLAEYAGMLDLQGVDAAKPTQEMISVDHVVLSGSASNGIVLRDGAGFAKDSTALTIKGSALYPVNIWSRAVGTLPQGDYTGNTFDEILLPAIAQNETILEDETMHARGVPYHVGYGASAGELRVGGNTTLTTLTIEPGVMLRFKKGAVLRTEVFQGTNPASGALIAVGTAASPIVFTSAEAQPAAGDWAGLTFGEVPSPADRIDFARIEYAGGATVSGSSSCPMPGQSINDAAIRIFGPPATQFVTNTTIVRSASNGIDRGYSSTTKIDFLPTNTFQSVALCKQTYPRDNGPCPVPVPCP
jgi:hypothetical protein